MQIKVGPPEQQRIRSNDDALAQDKVSNDGGWQAAPPRPGVGDYDSAPTRAQRPAGDNSPFQYAQPDLSAGGSPDRRATGNNAAATAAAAPAGRRGRPADEESADEMLLPV